MSKKKSAGNKREDKRVTFTKTAIKDTLIAQIKRMPYDEIGIVTLCDEAMISRSAFYLHYNSLYEVLDEVVEDAITEHPNMISLILGKYGNLDFDKSAVMKEDDKYVGLFSDRKTSGVLIDKITERYKDVYIDNVLKEHKLTKPEAEILFFVQVIGMIGAATDVKSKSTKRWLKISKLTDTVLDKGIEGLEKENV